MNIPFPMIYPFMIGPDWFNADRPIDEDAELTRLEEANKRWLNSIGQKYMKPLPTKPNPAPAEEPETDDDVFIVTGNEDAEEESEESQDDVDDEMLTTEDLLTQNIDMESESLEEVTDSPELDPEAVLWPYVPEAEQEQE